MRAAASTVTSRPARQRDLDRRSAGDGQDRIAYPISTFVWVIAPLDSGKAKLLKQFLLFAISNQGQTLGKPLLYAPMPKVVQVASAKTIAKIKQKS